MHGLRQVLFDSTGPDRATASVSEPVRLASARVTAAVEDLAAPGAARKSKQDPDRSPRSTKSSQSLRIPAQAETLCWLACMLFATLLSLLTDLLPHRVWGAVPRSDTVRRQYCPTGPVPLGQSRALWPRWWGLYWLRCFSWS